MKKALLFSIFSLLALVQIRAQVFVDGTKLDPSNSGHYLELDPLYRPDGRCAFKVDYGQQDPADDYLSDAAGKRFDFRSLVDGLNFFYEEGWEMVQITESNRGRRFLLKRRF